MKKREERIRVFRVLMEVGDVDSDRIDVEELKVHHLAWGHSGTGINHSEKKVMKQVNAALWAQQKALTQL